MATRVGMHEAKTNFSQLVEAARRGEDVVVERSGSPVARIVRYDEGGGLATLHGVWKGRIEMADDFDELPHDIARMLGMRDG